MGCYGALFITCKIWKGISLTDHKGKTRLSSIGTAVYATDVQVSDKVHSAGTFHRKLALNSALTRTTAVVAIQKTSAGRLGEGGQTF